MKKTLDKTYATGVNEKYGIVTGKITRCGNAIYIEDEYLGTVQVIPSTIRYRVTATVGDDYIFEGDRIIVGDEIGTVGCGEYCIYVTVGNHRYSLKELLEGEDDGTN